MRQTRRVGHLDVVERNSSEARRVETEGVDAGQDPQAARVAGYDEGADAFPALGRVDLGEDDEARARSAWST